MECIVFKALEYLTDRLSRGSKRVILSNVEDTERTKDLLKKLYDDGQDINPDLIFEWALKNDKWLDRDAKKLREFSQSIFNGTNPRIKYKMPEDIIKRFHDECEMN